MSLRRSYRIVVSLIDPVSRSGVFYEEHPRRDQSLSRNLEMSGRTLTILLLSDSPVSIVGSYIQAYGLVILYSGYILERLWRLCVLIAGQYYNVRLRVFVRFADSDRPDRTL